MLLKSEVFAMVDLLRIMKGQKKYNGCTRDQLILKSKLSSQAVDREIQKLKNLGKIEKIPISKIGYRLKK